jgi:hypothetical protein
MLLKIFYLEVRDVKKILLILCILLVFLAACQTNVDTSADANTDTDDTTAGTSADAEANVEADVDIDEVMDEVEETVEETMDEVEEVVDDVSEELKSFFTGMKTLEYQVDYTMTVQAGGSSAGTLTYYVKGVDQMRIYSMAQGMESRTYLMDGTITSCVDTGSWLCNEVSNYEISAGVDEDVKANVDTYVTTKLESRTIAGVSTDCYRIVTDDGQVDYCFSPEGVPLFIETSSDGSVVSTLEATSYSTSVSASVFALPEGAGEMQMPDGMNIPGY